MLRLYLFNSYEEFEASQEYLALPYIVFDGEHVHYSVDPPIIKVPLGANGVENGYGWVDLKLPSGTKWAQCNIGATIPYEPGLLFQWGRVDGYEYGDKNHQFSSDDPPTPVSGKSYTTGDILSPEDDAAYVATSGKAHIPTKEQIQELIDNTTVKWTTINGVNGRKFTSSNGNSIFIPAAGYREKSYFIGQDGYGFICSSSRDIDKPYYIYSLEFYSDSFTMSTGTRCGGVTVRPVSES